MHVSVCHPYISVFASNWFEHIKTWYQHRHEMDFLYVTYEEMIQVGKHNMQSTSISVNVSVQYL